MIVLSWSVVIGALVAGGLAGAVCGAGAVVCLWWALGRELSDSTEARFKRSVAAVGAARKLATGTLVVTPDQEYSLPGTLRPGGYELQRPDGTPCGWILVPPAAAWRKEVDR